MIVLGIESTAHTLGIGIVTDEKPYILSDVRKVYKPPKGGIHPREASRFMSEVIAEAIEEALNASKLTINDVDAIAVALGPGLGPCLRVGATVARALSTYFSKPLIPVNHAVAHIEIGKLLTGAKDPLIVYLSGGNTMIVALLGRRYRVFGETLDIALGNFQDTFVRELGLAPPYIVNNVHQIDICAEGGKFIDLPYIVKGQDVTFSGLLTEALKLFKTNKVKLNDLCYSIREIAYSAIVEVSERGLAHTKKKEILLVGGVAASPSLRRKFELMASERGVKVFLTPAKYAVDNGVMIAWTGLLLFKNKVVINPEKAFVKQRWRIDEVDIPWASN